MILFFLEVNVNDMQTSKTIEKSRKKHNTHNIIYVHRHYIDNVIKYFVITCTLLI